MPRMKFQMLIVPAVCLVCLLVYGYSVSQNNDTTPKQELSSSQSKALESNSTNATVLTPYVSAAVNSTGQANQQLSPSQLKKIVFWNDFFGSNDYWFGFGQEPFLRVGCKVNTCYTTDNKSLFPLDQVDAIVWHSRSNQQTFPDIRYPHTRYVFFVEESPKHSTVLSTSLAGVFNYTMTYRLDSDIPAPYGSFVKRDHPLPASDTNFAANKTKLVAWFVSNCFTSSKREELVRMLQNHIGIDIYGSCGTLTCSKNTSNECYQMVQRDYKFVLAFENSMCTDYVTEKFFDVLKYNVVPVVYGFADYSKVAPPHSYIDVLDFDNVTQLANYLISVSKNDTAYNEFFRWKTEYEIQGPTGKHFCKLCELLHTDAEPKVYTDLHKWFDEDQCVDGQEFIQKLKDAYFQ